MDRIEKFKKYFTAQAKNMLPHQRGGRFGPLSVDNALKWVNKFCNLAEETIKIVSPVQQVADRVKNEVKCSERPRINKLLSSQKPHKSFRRRKRKRSETEGSGKTQPHKLVKRSKKR
jgi:hypothetical protein